MFQDIQALTSENWNDIHHWLTYFWIYVPLVLVFALTMVTAHAIIPSLIITGQLPESAGKIRVAMTAFAALVFVAAVIMMVLTVDRTLDLEKFWDRWLI
mgnify:FL=1